jgi:alpha-N-arabinofuranosidase
MHCFQKLASPLGALIFLLALITFVFSYPLAAADMPTITLDLTKPGALISPTLYGLMTEEINHSYDGGIYAELIQNRIFKDDPKIPVHWSVAPENAGLISLDETQPIKHTVLTTCLRFDARQASPGHRVGIANDGYWGVPVRARTAYRASFYAKTDGSGSGPLTVDIESSDGVKIFAVAQVPQISGQWQKYTVTLATGDNITPSAGNRFVISTESPGIIWFNLVSLFPPTFNARSNGNRIDLMQKLIDMKSTFLRFPGGNYLEGDTTGTRFPWKNSLHDLAQRPGHQGCWSYRSSDGLGLLEYMEWCEDMRVKPVLAVYAGYSLKGDHVEVGPTLQPYVDEALEEIEYVTGDTNTKWGAMRSADGHPEPFKLTYVEIGNEDQFDKSHSYDGRFAQFYDAIKAKHPYLQLIATMRVNTCKPDLIDDHYYADFDHMVGINVPHLDRYDRSGPKIFLGEWATREGVPTTNLHAALADAAWMTAIERNADIIVMSCYAPLFVNVNHGGMEWKSDLIGFDALTSYCSPSYYVQKLFAENLGHEVVSIVAQNIPTRTWQPPLSKNEPVPAALQIPTLFCSATRTIVGGLVYMKIVNTESSPQAVRINLKGASRIEPEGSLVAIGSADPDDANSIAAPTNIVPFSQKLVDLGRSFTHTFEPFSVSMIKIQAAE